MTTVAKFHGGVLDGMTIACDPADTEFDHVEDEIVTGPYGSPVRVQVIYRYRRRTNGDFVLRDE